MGLAHEECPDWGLNPGPSANIELVDALTKLIWLADQTLSLSNISIFLVPSCGYVCMLIGCCNLGYREVEVNNFLTCKVINVCLCYNLGVEQYYNEVVIP